MMWLDDWEARKHQIMVEDTAHTCKQYLYVYQQEDLEEDQ